MGIKQDGVGGKQDGVYDLTSQNLAGKAQCLARCPD